MLCYNGATLKPILHRIWSTLEKWFENWCWGNGPDSHSQTDYGIYSVSILDPTNETRWCNRLRMRMPLLPCPKFPQLSSYLIVEASWYFRNFCLECSFPLMRSCLYIYITLANNAGFWFPGGSGRGGHAPPLQMPPDSVLPKKFLKLDLTSWISGLWSLWESHLEPPLQLGFAFCVIRKVIIL